MRDERQTKKAARLSREIAEAEDFLRLRKTRPEIDAMDAAYFTGGAIARRAVHYAVKRNRERKRVDAKFAEALELSAKRLITKNYELLKEL